MASTSALSHRSFRIVWIGSLFAYIAQWVQQVAFAWVAYENASGNACPRSLRWRMWCMARTGC